MICVHANQMKSFICTTVLRLKGEQPLFLVPLVTLYPQSPSFQVLTQLAPHMTSHVKSQTSNQTFAATSEACFELHIVKA